MKAILTVGKVLRPRGLKGEFKIELYTSNSSRYSCVKQVIIDEKTFGVESIKPEGDFAYIKLVGVDTPEAAEALRGKALSVNRNELPPPPSGEHYIVDLIGSDVLVDGDKLGELVDVQQYGSADVYVVRPTDGKGTYAFPALKELIRETDVQKGVIVLEGYLFRRVAVFND